MNGWLKKSIRLPSNRVFLRVFGVFGSLLFAMTLLYALLIIPQQKAALQQVLYSQASTVARTIVQACTDAMLSEDFGFIVEHNLQVLVNNRTIRAVEVYPRRGNALRITSTGWELIAPEAVPAAPEHGSAGILTSATGGSYYRYREPILFSGLNWGAIQIDFDTSEYDANILAMYHRMGLISLLAILVMLPIGYLFARWLTRPISTISAAAARVAGGDLDVHVKLARNDEIGQLSDSFNLMVDALRASSKELNQANIELEDKVAQRTAQLFRANLAKDSFLATMSHEIRTPLAGLLGMLELLDMSSLDAKQRQMVLAARTSSNSLLRIVNDILDWSKIEAGKLELATEVASLRKSLQAVFDTYSQLTVGKDILLRVEIDPVLHEWHRYDPLRLSQILNNFISNAIKFTAQGSVLIRAQRIAADDAHEHIRFSVCDTGVGIDPEHQSRLFMQYEQASANTARMYGGTGLGLAICRKLADLMHGTLSVESALGEGSTFSFTVTLPVAYAPAPVAHASAAPPQTAQLTAPVRSAVVLLVDDHPINRMLLQQQLHTLGMQTHVAVDGNDGIARWREQDVDLIITDCHMPNLDGYDMTRSIRLLARQDGRRRIPIIAWTANVLSDESERCLRAGMDDMLTKPTELNVLRAMLLKWLSGAPEHPAAWAETVLDRNVLESMVRGTEAQREMLALYVQQTRLDVQALQQMVQHDKADEIASAAHRIKGASRMVGALQMTALCERIEGAARRSELQTVRDLADLPLSDALKRVQSLHL